MQIHPFETTLGTLKVSRHVLAEAIYIHICESSGWFVGYLCLKNQFHPSSHSENLELTILKLGILQSDRLEAHI